MEICLTTEVGNLFESVSILIIGLIEIQYFQNYLKTQFWLKMISCLNHNGK